MVRVDSTAASSCCKYLALALAASQPPSAYSIAYPNTTAYTNFSNSYWSSNQAVLEPACVFSPSTSEAVAVAVRTLTSSSSCQFAIKSGGHAPAAGFSNIDTPGVTIDLATLNATTLSKDTSTVDVGPGARWSQVYDYLQPYGLTAAGGRNGAVGVGGLTIGGGVSYYSPKVGWTCDTVVDFEVVLPCGTITHANSSHNADLFKALKGGGNNFGIVTRITFRTVPSGTIAAGPVSNDIDQRKAVFEAFAGIANSPSYDENASIVTGLLFNSTSKHWTLSNTAVYTAPNTHPAVYEELFSIPNISNKVQLTNVSSFAHENPLPQFNWFFYTITFGPSAVVMNAVFDALNSTIFDFNPSNGGVTWSFAFEPLPTAITKRVAGSNVIGAAGNQGNAILLLLSGLWFDADASGSVNAVAAKATEAAKEAARKHGMLHDFTYLNYASPDQKPFSSYGSDELAFLHRVQRKYDPQGLWARSVPGGFKLRP